LQLLAHPILRTIDLWEKNMAKKKAITRTPIPPIGIGTVPNGTDIGTIVNAKIQEIHLNSWDEFKSFLVQLYGDHGFVQNRFLFRGQGRDYWKLESTFDRQVPAAQYEKGLRVMLYQEMLQEFKRRLADSDIPQAVLEDERLLTSLGQHYGLPTRLLDWSGSPYYAAFFAFSSNIQYFGTKDKVAIYVLDRNRPIWNKEYGVEIIDIAPSSNTRIRVQQGKFTLQRTPEQTLDEYAIRYEDPLALRKVIVPANEARKVIADLDSMGINHDSVYRDLDGIARATFFRMLYKYPAQSEKG